LVVGNPEKITIIPINIQITDILWYYSRELIVIQDQFSQIGQIPYLWWNGTCELIIV